MSFPRSCRTETLSRDTRDTYTTFRLTFDCDKMALYFPMRQLLINIDVDDVDKAVAFYTEAFDVKVGRRFDQGSWNSWAYDELLKQPG